MHIHAVLTVMKGVFSSSRVVEELPREEREENLFREWVDELREDDDEFREEEEEERVTDGSSLLISVSSTSIPCGSCPLISNLACILCCI